MTKWALCIAQSRQENLSVFISPITAEATRLHKHRLTFRVSNVSIFISTLLKRCKRTLHHLEVVPRVPLSSLSNWVLHQQLHLLVLCGAQALGHLGNRRYVFFYRLVCSEKQKNKKQTFICCFFLMPINSIMSNISVGRVVVCDGCHSPHTRVHVLMCACLRVTVETCASTPVMDTSTSLS